MTRKPTNQPINQCTPKMFVLSILSTAGMSIALDQWLPSDELNHFRYPIQLIPTVTAMNIMFVVNRIDICIVYVLQLQNLNLKKSNIQMQLFISTNRLNRNWNSFFSSRHSGPLSLSIYFCAWLFLLIIVVLVFSIQSHSEM